MKLVEAYSKIVEFANVPFKEYLSEAVIKANMLKINKGKTGQMLEITIGLKLSNTTLDFEDGELKTNKCDKSGKPKETMFITQTASIIDELLVSKEFKSTKLYEKLKHLLYVIEHELELLFYVFPDVIPCFLNRVKQTLRKVFNLIDPIFHLIRNVYLFPLVGYIFNTT